MCWRLPAELTRELTTLSPLELQRWFLWGSHTAYARPADVFLHLIHGWVYENRFAWPHKRKVCSENDAHALYVTLSGLALATGKRLYTVLRDQILLSVLARQGADGAFRHGEWTDSMESHFRLHCSGMHLMMDALDEKPDPEIRAHLARAAAFVARKHQSLREGVWFPHDELEESVESMKRAPFRWAESRRSGSPRRTCSS